MVGIYVRINKKTAAIRQAELALLRGLFYPSGIWGRGGMMRLFLSIFVFVTVHSIMANASPVRVMPISEIYTESVLQDPILDYEGDWAIARSPSFYNEGRDLYLVKTPGWYDQETLQALQTYGHLWHFQPGEFALLHIPDIGRVEELSAVMHMAGGTCGSIRHIDGSPLATEWVQTGAPAFHGMTEEIAYAANDLLQQVSVDFIQKAILEMQNWETRFHRHPAGQQAGQRLAELYRVLIPANRSDVSIELFNHSKTPQQSVIVRIPGTKNPSEVVVFGSHLDSINGMNWDFAPGADDNASGTATNLEIFRVLMANNLYPEKTIEFHAYAAEEIGLVGSNEIAQAYRHQGVDVSAMIQYDMTAYSGRPFDRIYLIANKTDRQLNENLARLAQDYLGLPTEVRSFMSGTSDHASWHRAGYPAAFPFENPAAYNRKIHTSDDVIDRLNAFDQSVAFTRLGLAYVIQFVGLGTH